MRYTAIALSFCIAQTVIVTSEVAEAQSSKPSARVCDSYARDYAENGSRQGRVIGGAAKGSLLGAGIGAIAGGAGTGAAIGAVVGTIGGGARRRSDADRMYHAAYQDCMAGRVR
jgi:outer membrane lipoprotein SlyB